MAKKESVFDEKAFLQAMSEGHGFKPIGDTPVPSEPVADEQPSTAVTPRQRRTKISDYEAIFLVPREPIEKRSFVGLRPDLYEIIATIVKRIGSGGVSAQAFLENVLRHHLSEHQDEINRLNREKLKKDIV